MKAYMRCRHEHVRCIHGDEIWARMSMWRGTIRRAACLDCGRALDRGLPEPCSVTHEPHWSTTHAPNEATNAEESS